jgi:MFS family permease
VFGRHPQAISTYLIKNKPSFFFASAFGKEMDFQGYLETVRLLPRSSKLDEEALVVDPTKGESQRFSVVVVLVALGFMYSVHNLIAPNMTAIAKLFHFNNYERDAYIGGELTLFFYFPGVFGALVAGVLSGLLDRRLLLAALAMLTSIACLFTARVGTFGELAWARAVTGFGIGGSLPVVYSLVGDWFPAKKRASATAFVTAASGAGVFVGQCVATITGSVDWRWPFVFIAVPSAVTGGLICFLVFIKDGVVEVENKTCIVIQPQHMHCTNGYPNERFSF